MYGIPEDFDPSIFVGARLDVVAFGAYVVNLSFEAKDPIRVMIGGGYVHAGPEAEGWADEVQDLPATESRMMQLAGHEVSLAAKLDDKRLRLVFDHGHSLTLIDNSDQYESFEIENSKRHWIV